MFSFLRSSSSLRILSKRFNSSTPSSSSIEFEARFPIYELRWYTISPEHYPNFLKLTNEKIHMRTEHSPLLGYWTTELGGLNEVVHIWGYDSLVQRQQIRNALVKDDKWNNEYMSVMRPMLSAQENVIMTPSDNIIEKFEESDEDDLPVYELEVLLPAEELENEDLRTKFNASLVGKWNGAVGTLNGSNIQLWRYPTLGHLDELLRTQQSTSELQQFTKVMLPTNFSPLN